MVIGCSILSYGYLYDRWSSTIDIQVRLHRTLTWRSRAELYRIVRVNLVAEGFKPLMPFGQIFQPCVYHFRQATIIWPPIIDLTIGRRILLVLIGDMMRMIYNHGSNHSKKLTRVWRIRTFGRCHYSEIQAHRGLSIKATMVKTLVKVWPLMQDLNLQPPDS